MGDGRVRGKAYGAEAGDSKSHKRKPVHAPTRGPSPLVPRLRLGHPMKGEHPLQNPRSSPGFTSIVAAVAFGGKQLLSVVELMVPKPGLEPGWVAPHAPQTCVSTSSTTSA